MAVVPCFAQKNVKRSLVVRAMSHDSQINERKSVYTTPGTSTTNCTTVGDTTTATTNCETTSKPAETHETIYRAIDVVNVVEADNQRYVIACRANWVGSNCATMRDGDLFGAEIKGTTMWVFELKGGNQGKAVRVKYRVMDIRPFPAN